MNKAFGATHRDGLGAHAEHGGKPTAVIVWGMPMGETEAVRFLQAGAAGVIRKTAPLAEFTDCIRAVAAGGSWMESDVPRDPRLARACRATFRAHAARSSGHGSGGARIQE